MSSTPKTYLVESVVHATQVLGAFAKPGETLRLRDVVERTHFSKGLCFRLLHTLHHCGLLEKVDVNRYRLTCDIRPRKRYRIGYAGQGAGGSFAAEVRGGLERAAEAAQVELIVVDNRYQPKVALRNAENLIRENLDLALEFQTDEAIAPEVAARYLEAGIPLIAIDIPHPGATYFGANNYQAGLLAGRYLGRWARSKWSGRVDEVLLLELARAGTLVHGRISGVLAGLKETVPDCPRALRNVLDREVEASRAADARAAAFSTENYRYELGGVLPNAVQIGLTPRREDPRLINGLATMDQRTAELSYVEGDLAKNPSFWVRDVRIARRYSRVGAATLPVEFRTTARVRMFGPAEMNMTITYLTVNGMPIDNPSPADTASPTLPLALLQR